MNIRQRNSFFIQKSSSGSIVEPEGLINQTTRYHSIILTSLALGNYTFEGIQTLGRHLSDIARQAHLARQFDVVEQASKLMLDLPLTDQQRQVASYYQAVCIKNQGNLDDARLTLERVAADATPHYRARALLTIGATYYESGNADAALPYYTAAARFATDCDLLTVGQSLCMVAVIRSIYGDHNHALADLENLFPLVRTVGRHYPAFYYDYLNSLAVELGEVGRVEEAQAALAIALASPFAPAHPNWAETRSELEEKRAAALHSAAAVRLSPEAASSPRENAERNLKLSRIRAVRRSAVISIPLVACGYAVDPDTSIARLPISQTTLDRLGRAFRPRAPPALS